MHDFVCSQLLGPFDTLAAVLAVIVLCRGVHISYMILNSDETILLFLANWAFVDLFLRSALALGLDDNLILLKELVHVAAKFVTELMQSELGRLSCGEPVALEATQCFFVVLLLILLKIGVHEWLPICRVGNIGDGLILTVPMVQGLATVLKSNHIGTHTVVKHEIAGVRVLPSVQTGYKRVLVLN